MLIISFQIIKQNLYSPLKTKYQLTIHSLNQIRINNAFNFRVSVPNLYKMDAFPYSCFSIDVLFYCHETTQLLPNYLNLFLACPYIIK